MKVPKFFLYSFFIVKDFIFIISAVIVLTIIQIPSDLIPYSLFAQSNTS